MNTKFVQGNDKQAIIEAGRLIKEGKLVAFPTETVYGLGANGLNNEAVASIYVAKGRPSDNPLILHVASLEEIEKIAYINDNTLKLASAFWPGPLTVVLPKKDIVPPKVTGGLNTVAVRMPSNEIARELIKNSGVPIAAPSANTSGKPSPTDAKDVLDDMNGKISMIIDGGRCDIGIESTVVDLTSDIPMILRPGEITLEMLKNVLPDAVYENGLCDAERSKEPPKCPGMKYKHYSPNADVIVFETGFESEIPSYIVKLKGKKIVLYLKNNTKFDNADIKYWGDTAEDMAKNLFADLREFDREGYDTILCMAPEMSELGQSVRNRLYKSAGYNIVK